MSARRNWTPRRLLAAGGGAQRITREEAEKRDREFDASTRLREMLQDRPDALMLFDAVMAGRKELEEHVRALMQLERQLRWERDDARTNADALDAELETTRNELHQAMDASDQLAETVEQLEGEISVLEQEARVLREETTTLRVQLSREQPSVDARM
jgi:chromosome segregation ATPase